MRIYIGGKITGLPEHICKTKFENAFHGLTLLNYDAVNPLRLPHNHDRSWKSFMREDLKALKTCGAIFLLNNWQNSRGARIENWYAKRYGLQIIYQPTETDQQLKTTN